MSPSRPDTNKAPYDSGEAPPDTGKLISRNDIEAKLRELQGEVEVIGEEAKSYALTVGIVILVGVMAVVFVFGRRHGRRNRTIVEVRRF
jgi:hypothetical protein